MTEQLSVSACTIARSYFELQLEEHGDSLRVTHKPNKENIE